MSKKAPKDHTRDNSDAAAQQFGPSPKQLTRSEARAKLAAAGALATRLGIPDNVEPVSDQEIALRGQLAAGARSSDELVDEERGTY